MVDALHLYADMKNKKRGVKQHMRARHECTHLQQRDTMLRNNVSGCFHVPKKQTTLQAGGVTATKPTDLCGCSPLPQSVSSSLSSRLALACMKILHLTLTSPLMRLQLQ